MDVLIRIVILGAASEKAEMFFRHSPQRSNNLGAGVAIRHNASTAKAMTPQARQSDRRWNNSKKGSIIPVLIVATARKRPANIHRPLAWASSAASKASVTKQENWPTSAP